MTEATNRDRAEWAACALDQFQRSCATDAEDVLTDLLCDLMHWADQTSYDFDAELARAKGNFDAEKEEELLVVEVVGHVYLITDQNIETGETFTNVFADTDHAGRHFRYLRAEYLKEGLDVETTDLASIAINTEQGVIESDDDDHFEIVDVCCVKIEKKELIA